METFLNRNFKVKGDVSCLYMPNEITESLNISNIEIQLWHKSPTQAIFLGKGLTDANGEYIIEFEIDSPVDYVVDGKISDVFIRAFYNGEELFFNSLLQGLVAYWKLDGNSNDSCHSNNGSDTDIIYSDANGKINSGAGFDGVTSKIMVPDSDDWTMADGEFTISMWVKRNTVGRNLFFGQCDSSGQAVTISFSLVFDSSDFIIANYGTGTLVALTSVVAVADAFWHHIVFVRRGNTIYLYLDNTVQSMTAVTAPMTDSGTSLSIGGWGEYAGLLLDGCMDEIGVWKGNGLSEDEIALLYNNGKGLQYPFK